MQKGDENAYDTVKDSFTAYFMPKKKIAYETYKFRQVVQQKDKNIDFLIKIYTRLRSLAATCEFYDEDKRNSFTDSSWMCLKSYKAQSTQRQSESETST